MSKRFRRPIPVDVGWSDGLAPRDVRELSLVDVDALEVLGKGGELVVRAVGGRFWSGKQLDQFQRRAGIRRDSNFCIVRELADI